MWALYLLPFKHKIAYINQTHFHKWFYQNISDSDGYEKFVEKQIEIVEHVQNQELSKQAHVHCNSEQIEFGKIIYNEHDYMNKKCIDYLYNYMYIC